MPNILEERDEIIGFKIPKIFSTDFAVDSWAITKGASSCWSKKYLAPKVWSPWL